jgi:hypothetical protein
MRWTEHCSRSDLYAIWSHNRLQSTPQGMTFTGLGVAIGLAGAVVASQAIAAMLFSVSRLDPVTYVIVIVLLTGVWVMSKS